MGRSYTPTHRVEYTDNDLPRLKKDMCWNKSWGRPTVANLSKWRDNFNKSFEPGGVNAHCTTRDGGILRISNCKIVHQFTNEIVAEFKAPMFEVV